MSTPALKRAVEHVGSQKALADKLGVTQSVVWYWLEKSRHGCPAEHVLKIEEVTDGKVSRHDLRPDIWPLRTVFHRGVLLESSLVDVGIGTQLSVDGPTLLPSV